MEPPTNESGNRRFCGAAGEAMGQRLLPMLAPAHPPGFAPRPPPPWIIAAVGRVLRLEALERGPRLDQRTIDRDVLARQQSTDPRLRQHGGEEIGRDIALQQPVAVGREARMILHRVVDPNADKPPEQRINLDPLHQMAPRAQRVEGLQQHRLQQLFRWDRLAPHL